MKKFSNGRLVEMTAEETARINAMRRRARRGQPDAAEDRIRQLEAQVAALLAERNAAETEVVSE